MDMSRIAYASAVAFSLFTGSVTADEESLCGCSPSKYTFTLDLSLSCPPVNVSRNNGIVSTFCQISSFGDANEFIEDLVPLEVEYIGVLELGQTFDILSQKNITSASFDGDSFDYESIVGDSAEQPKVIQLNIFARNAKGQPLVNFFAISFTNACDAYPTLIEGESAGWTQFTKLEAPPHSVCPAVPTDSPSESPNANPTIAPVETDSPTIAIIPTDAPVAPTEAPVTPETDAPTEAPVAPETDAPTVAPVTPETDAPTEAPVTPGTLPPIPTPTFSPTTTMSMSMNLLTDPLGDLLAGMATEMSMVNSVVKNIKSIKFEKKTKSEKHRKVEKSEKSEKEDKSDKSSKKEKRRRLRIRPLVLEM